MRGASSHLDAPPQRVRSRDGIGCSLLLTRGFRHWGFIPVARIADLFLNGGEAYDYNGRRLTYPVAKLVYWAGGNPFHPD